MPSLPPESPRVVPIRPSLGDRPGAKRRFDCSFPVTAGILFGLGLGGFFDGVVLHQILQWHHVLTSAGYPGDSVRNLRINSLWDGIFQAGSCMFIAGGLVVLWRAARRRHVWWSTRLLAGTMLIGFGAFNVIEGVIDHHILQLHHVNETVPHEQWLAWDLGFLAWGALMLIGGWALYRGGQARSEGRTQDAAGDAARPAAWRRR